MKNCLAYISLILALHTAVSVSAANNANDLYGSISIETIQAMPGDIVDVAVTATGFASVAAFDCYISFDNHVLDTISLSGTVINIHPAISGTFFNILNGNKVAVTWNSMNPVTIPDDEKLFDLRFIFCDDLYPCALSGTSSALAFIEGQTHFTTDGFVEINLEYNNGGIYAVNPLRALTINQSGNGSVTVDNSLYNEPLVFTEDVLLTLQALPASGYLFNGWSGDLIGMENPTELLMSENKTVEVTFIQDLPDLYTISFQITNNYGEEIADAVVVLNEVAYDPGHYVFDEMQPGTYSYLITHDCYPDKDGAITLVDEDVSENLELIIIPGDANGDGDVNVLDVITVANHYIGNDPNPFCFHNADINQDGEINAIDIILLIGLFR